MKTAKYLPIEKLKEIGADGLCKDGCGCGLKDLASCGEIQCECVPAVKIKTDNNVEDNRFGYRPIHRRGW